MKRLTRLLYGLVAAAIVLSCSAKDDGDPFTISSLKDLDGRTVAVLSGSVQDLIVSRECPGSVILRSESDTDIYNMVKTGKACAALTSDLSWAMAREGYPEVVELEEKLFPVPIAFGFGKDDPELLGRFNAFLKDYLAENDIEQAVREWSDPSSGREMPSLEQAAGDGRTLHFAVNATVPPFDYIRNGEAVGLEPEILALFAISEGRKWDFTSIAFSGLISYMQTGRMDACCSILSVTPERQESLSFSDPWYHESTIILVGREHAPLEVAGGGDNGIAPEHVPFLKSLKESLVKSLIHEDRWKMVLEGLRTTILISLLAAIFGTMLGALLCWMSMHRRRLLSGTASLFTGFMRNMPQVVFLMLMFYVVFGNSGISGIWVAIIAFSLCFGACTSALFKTSVESIDKGQGEAALSMGFGKVKAFVNVILPQAAQRALPVYKGEFVGLVKSTSIVGYIAVFDLTKAGDIIRSRTFEAFFPLILVTLLYFLVIWILSFILKHVEKATQPKRKKFFR